MLAGFLQNHIDRSAAMQKVGWTVCVFFLCVYCLTEYLMRFVGRYVWPLEYRCTTDVTEVFFFALCNEARSFENVYKFTADQVD